jgi:cytochrome c oxidase accessory protein FixG
MEDYSLKEKPDSTVSFRDRLATMDERGKRKWVFAKQPSGKYYRARSIVSFFFFALFAGMPFIKVHGRPLFLFNITGAKFILFGKVFWPQDFFIFGLAMVSFIIFIVLFTAAFGRLFCGWVCPQTIFMEMIFRKIEYLIDGDAPAQKLLRNAAWTGAKIRKRLLKHVIFFFLSFVIANFFLSYIIGIDELIATIREPVSQHAGSFLGILVFSGVFYAVYAWFREQACTVVCPYGRLQSVLLDRNSMAVAYNYKRGEPRGKFRKNSTEVKGDCIDCFQCVKVCPTGIDIRNGIQMECVGCTACIDACDKMMAAIGKPTGLISYTSENGIAKGEKLRFTLRMKMYTLLLLVLAGILALLLISRNDVDGTIVRAPGQLYQERGEDSLSNLYTIKVVNKTLKDIPLTLRVMDAPGRIMEAEGKEIMVKKEDQGKGSFFIVLPKVYITKRKMPLKIGLYAGEELITTVTTNFMGPFTRF